MFVFCDWGFVCISVRVGVGFYLVLWCLVFVLISFLYVIIMFWIEFVLVYFIRITLFLESYFFVYLEIELWRGVGEWDYFMIKGDLVRSLFFFYD